MWSSDFRIKNKILLLFLSNYFILLLSLVGKNVSSTTTIPQKRNIIVLLFPDGSGSNYQIKSLFDHSLISNPNYLYHVILHKADYKIWKEKTGTTNNSQFKFYTFGKTEKLEPLECLSGTSFNRDILAPRMQLFIQEFTESKILEQLKKENVNYDLLETDVPNYLSVIIKDTFKIERVIYLSHRPLPQIFGRTFELNPSYYPNIGSTNGQVLSFKERFISYFYYLQEKLYAWINQGKELKLLSSLGYSTENLKDVYIYKSLVLLQYPEGLGFPLSMPPNMNLLNGFNIYDYETSSQKSSENIIYVNKDIYENNKKIFNKNPHYKITTFPQDLYKNSNSNVKCAIVKDFNEITMSLVNSVPVLVHRDGMMWKNIQTFVKEKKYGDTIENLSEYESKVKTISNDLIYKINLEKVARIFKGNKDARERYVHWVNYGFRHGYDTLVVGLYEKGNWFSIRGIDVFAFSVGCVLLVVFLMYSMIKLFLRTCSRKTVKKVKKD